MLFTNVMAEQRGLPIPAVLVLLAMGVPQHVDRIPGDRQSVLRRAGQLLDGCDAPA